MQIPDRMAGRLVQWRKVRAQHRRRRQWVRQRHQKSPGFRTAVVADTRVALRSRGEDVGEQLGGAALAAEALRLSVTTDAFLAQVLYRGRVALLRRGIPALPGLCHSVSMMTSSTCIGDPVVIQPGLYLPHGQVVVDGITDVGAGVTIAPFVTIGLKAGNFQGPSIGDGVHVGTGSRIIGPQQVGTRARIGANAVVTADVRPGDTVVGVPARSIGASTPAPA